MIFINVSLTFNFYFYLEYVGVEFQITRRFICKSEQLNKAT